MDYAYAKATSGRNTLRRTGMELPNGDDLAFTYSSSAHDAAASRVSTVTLDIGGGAVTIAGYEYNGVGHLVGTDYPAIEVMSLQYGPTSGAYPDLDRFDRVTSSRWTKDLATDRDLYDLDITYDRDSNILRVEDHVQTGFDVAYMMDELNRLTVADQGTWTGSAITSTTRTEDWTLDQVGNWDEYDLDEDGDTTLELNETRGHTLANELTSRNTNGTGPVEFEPEYDGAGHLVDDTEDYAYVWDTFGRLRQVKETGTGDLVAEYTYNGLGYRIGWHYDADVDGDVDGSDPWYRFVYDERWRIVATYRGSDSEPKEQFVHHAAGDSGYGTASYIDDVILRDRDDNSGWTSAADGTLEKRIYHCQNWRHDVVALVDGNGDQVEMARYSPYGVPFGLPAGDLDSDGDVDAADLTVFDALIAYDVRADLDLDGDYDATDRSTINANRGTSAGLGVLSQSGVASRKGYAGYAFAPELQDARRVYHVRHRVLDADLGRWMRRDPLVYVDGPSAYSYTRTNPLSAVDPMGLTGVAPAIALGFSLECCWYTPFGPLLCLSISVSGTWSNCYCRYDRGGEGYFFEGDLAFSMSLRLGGMPGCRVDVPDSVIQLNSMGEIDPNLPTRLVPETFPDCPPTDLDSQICLSTSVGFGAGFGRYANLGCEICWAPGGGLTWSCGIGMLGTGSGFGVSLGASAAAVGIFSPCAPVVAIPPPGPYGSDPIGGQVGLPWDPSFSGGWGR